MQKNYPSDSAAKVLARLPSDVKIWLRDQARMNGSSQNSEIIRALRERMVRVDSDAFREEKRA